MLVRSSSTPILNSWVHTHPVEVSPEPEFFHQIAKPQIISITRTRSVDDLGVQKRKPFTKTLNGFVQEEAEEEQDFSTCFGMNPLFSSSGLDELVEEEEYIGGGGFGSKGNGNGNGNGDGDGFSDSTHGNDNTDAYYRKMIESDPGNALILGNYARFLKEVQGDLVKAEEYCERAILANPSDGNVVAMYADLVWEVHKDSSRAEKYFDQAVQAEPNDCYVMASYAHFLWDAEEEEEEEEEDEEEEDEEENQKVEEQKNEESENRKNLTRPPDLFQGITYPSVVVY